MFVLLAILGISFLIFIHEMGHFLMARRVGMRVEVFSIGFGRPIFSWMHKDVKWQVGWLPFGGYVKIAGSELDKEQNPYEIPDGFFGKKPIDRIKVALMGPAANLLFAVLAFSFLWVSGGREKNFSDFTSKIGWVDPDSELYAQGIRPGDEVTSYNNQQFESAADHTAAPMRSEDHIAIRGEKVNYLTGEKVPFEDTVKVYQHPGAIEKGRLTAGILSPASYIIYNRLPGGQENPLPESSPLKNSGIEYGDRIVWANGEIVFSVPQLNQIINSNRVLLTIDRNGQILLTRTPRVPVKELKPNSEFREELKDWQFEAKLNNIKMQNLFALPYNISNDGVVLGPLQFVDKEDETNTFPKIPYTPLENPLQPGDRILAIDGIPIKHASELLKHLQTYQVNLIVQRNPTITQLEKWYGADQAFDRELNIADLQTVANSIGTPSTITHQGDFYLLKPTVPKRRNELKMSPEKQAQVAAEVLEQKHAIQSIEDPELRAHALRLFDQQEKRLLIGLPLIQDRHVQYNPGPFTLFKNVFQEIQRTLAALFSGILNPKWLMGPVGIIQVVHDTSMNGLLEAVYWLGAISLNLGVINLLPIPVLDGGTILMSLVEMATGKKMPPKTLEKLIIPFVVLLVGFFVFLTYHDLERLFRGFW